MDYINIASSRVTQVEKYSHKKKKHQKYNIAVRTIKTLYYQ